MPAAANPEDCLDGWAGVERALLRRELALIDGDYYRRAGLLPTASHFRRRSIPSEPTPPPELDDDLPRTFGRYTPQKLSDHGGIDSGYLAHDPERPVVVTRHSHVLHRDSPGHHLAQRRR